MNQAAEGLAEASESRNALTEIDQFRDTLMRNLLLIIGGLAPCVLIISSFRSAIIEGQTWLLTGQSVGCLLLVWAAWQRRQLSSWFCGCLLAVIFIGFGMTGLLFLGISGMGVFFLICAQLLATLGGGTRAGLVVLMVNLAVFLLIGFAVNQQWLHFAVDFNRYNTSAAAWITALVTVAAIMLLIWMGIERFFGFMAGVIVTLARKSSELSLSNQRLQNEIRDRRRAEKEIISLAQDLEQARKMEIIGTMAGGVAHDLNNVLSAITGYPEYLLGLVDKDSELYEPLMMIKQSGQKAATMAQDLLMLARRGVRVEQDCDLNALIADYLDSPEHRRLVSFHPDVHIETCLASDLPALKGSPIHLEKVIMNLVSNAAEAMPDGGRISIATANRIADEGSKPVIGRMAGDGVVLEVADNGVGMTDEEIGKIFEPFFSTKTMGRSGTGLGMTVVLSAVQDHHGAIDVHSVAKQGTRFTVFFPASPCKARKPPRRSHPARGDLSLPEASIPNIS